MRTRMQFAALGLGLYAIVHRHSLQSCRLNVIRVSVASGLASAIQSDLAVRCR